MWNAPEHIHHVKGKQALLLAEKSDHIGKNP